MSNEVHNNTAYNETLSYLKKALQIDGGSVIRNAFQIDGKSVMRNMHNAMVLHYFANVNCLNNLYYYDYMISHMPKNFNNSFLHIASELIFQNINLIFEGNAKLYVKGTESSINKNIMPILFLELGGYRARIINIKHTFTFWFGTGIGTFETVENNTKNKITELFEKMTNKEYQKTNEFIEQFKYYFIVFCAIKLEETKVVENFIELINFSNMENRRFIYDNGLMHIGLIVAYTNENKNIVKLLLQYWYDKQHIIFNNTQTNSNYYLNISEIKVEHIINSFDLKNTRKRKLDCL
jgi:hypothetical protein